MRYSLHMADGRLVAHRATAQEIGDIACPGTYSRDWECPGPFSFVAYSADTTDMVGNPVATAAEAQQIAAKGY